MNSVSPGYDDDGNATAYPLPVAPASNSTLVWDAENRMTSTTVGTTTTTYLYDAQSRRIAKTTGTETTLTVYDGWNPVADYQKIGSGAPTLSHSYTWGVDLSGTLQGAGGVGGLLAERVHTGTPATYYPTYDGNGNVSEYLTTSGGIAAHFEYDPFGNTVVNTDTGGLFKYRFSTKPRDAETGLYYYGYRYYDPATGRWPSRDPERANWRTREFNIYSFIKNQSLALIDRLGLAVSLPFGDGTDGLGGTGSTLIPADPLPPIEDVPEVPTAITAPDVVQDISPDAPPTDPGSSNDPTDQANDPSNSSSPSNDPPATNNPTESSSASDCNQQVEANYRAQCQVCCGITDSTERQKCYNEARRRRQLDGIDCTNYYGNGWSGGGGTNLDTAAGAWPDSQNPILQGH